MIQCHTGKIRILKGVKEMGMNYFFKGIRLHLTSVLHNVVKGIKSRNIASH